jgi:hypothetical protein
MNEHALSTKGRRSSTLLRGETRAERSDAERGPYRGRRAERNEAQREDERAADAFANWKSPSAASDSRFTSLALRLLNGHARFVTRLFIRARVVTCEGGEASRRRGGAAVGRRCEDRDLRRLFSTLRAKMSE